MRTLDKILGFIGLSRKDKDKQLQRSFNAAQISHLTSDWLTSLGTYNSSLYKGNRIIRSRARDLCMNNAYAVKFLDIMSKNVIGPDGFTLKSKAGDYNNGKFITDKIAVTKIQNGYYDWGKPNTCTLNENISFREVCSVILKSIARDGEILIRPIKAPSVNKYGYALQLINADYLDDSFNAKLSNGNSVVMGVEVDTARKPVAYHLKKTNIESEIYGTYQSGQLQRVPASEVLHLFVKTYPGQLRGVSWFAPSMMMMKMLYGFEEAKLVDARIGASTTLALKYKDNADGSEVNKANISGGNESTTDENLIYQDITPGQTYVVPKGMEPWMFDPKSPAGNEAEFAMHYLRGIASGLLVSFISLANNYSEVNYSSGRLNLLDERETFRELQAWFREHFLDWNFPQFLEMALLTQAITLPISKYDKFNEFWFTGRSWPWVDPQKDINAKVIALKNNLDTYENILSENGIWPDEHWEQLAKEKQMFKDNGWIWPSDNNAPSTIIAEDEVTVPKNGKAKNIIHN